MVSCMVSLHFGHAPYSKPDDLVCLSILFGPENGIDLWDSPRQSAEMQPYWRLVTGPPETLTIPTLLTFLDIACRCHSTRGLKLASLLIIPHLEFALACRLFKHHYEAMSSNDCSLLRDTCIMIIKEEFQEVGRLLRDATLWKKFLDLPHTALCILLASAELRRLHENSLYVLAQKWWCNFFLTPDVISPEEHHSPSRCNSPHWDAKSKTRSAVEIRPCFATLSPGGPTMDCERAPEHIIDLLFREGLGEFAIEMMEDWTRCRPPGFGSVSFLSSPSPSSSPSLSSGKEEKTKDSSFLSRILPPDLFHEFAKLSVNSPDPSPSSKLLAVCLKQSVIRSPKILEPQCGWISDMAIKIFQSLRFHMMSFPFLLDVVQYDQTWFAGPRSTHREIRKHLQLLSWSGRNMRSLATSNWADAKAPHHTITTDIKRLHKWKPKEMFSIPSFLIDGYWFTFQIARSGPDNSLSLGFMLDVVRSGLKHSNGFHLMCSIQFVMLHKDGQYHPMTPLTLVPFSPSCLEHRLSNPLAGSDSWTSFISTSPFVQRTSNCDYVITFGVRMVVNPC